MAEDGEAEEGRVEVGVKEGISSIALLPCGSISGHFIQLPGSICYGLQLHEVACERECSRGEDYRLIKLTIIDYNSKKEQDVMVECRGHDAARLSNIDHAQGYWRNLIPCQIPSIKQHVKKITSFYFIMICFFYP
ncbi:unnamed protein product [Linum tenue]|uniref:Uncharacterized protein n=1 Tax=Linum tenue TaxID=586396 RepID=A0AAV0RX55_9ROSI|nr:unnamed protein product [Linum tenue]